MVDETLASQLPFIICARFRFPVHSAYVLFIPSELGTSDDRLHK